MSLPKWYRDWLMSSRMSDAVMRLREACRSDDLSHAYVKEVYEQDKMFDLIEAGNRRQAKRERNRK